MKRTLVGLASLAIAISSCTNNELIEGVQSPDNAIDYAPYVGRATRATSMTLENLDNFRVVAYSSEGAYADAAAFTANGYAEDVTLSGGIWGGTETRYWPEEPELMSFFAYSPKDAGTFAAATAGGYPSLAFGINADPASQVDLLGAVMMDQTRKSDNKNVAFNLKHLLTQVAFKAKAGSPAYSVKVKSIKMSKVNPEGTFTYDGSETVGTWGITSGTPADYTYIEHTDITTNTDTPAGSETAVAVEGENLMLIPSAAGTLEGVEMEVVYQCYKAGVEPLETLGGEITKMVTLTDADEWTMGKKVSYVMLLHRQSGPIVFEPEIEEWADETAQDKEVNDIFNVREIDLADGKATIQKIEINNRAGVDAAFTLTSSEPWLKISANADGSDAVQEYTYAPTTRAVAATTTLYVVAGYNGTANATREATLTWARTGAKPVELKVSQVVMSEDKVFGEITTTSITDAEALSGKELVVTETMGELLDYTITSNDSWLTIGKAANNEADATTTVSMTGVTNRENTFYLYATSYIGEERTASITLKRAGMVDKTLEVKQTLGAWWFSMTREDGKSISWANAPLVLKDGRVQAGEPTDMGLNFMWGSLVGVSTYMNNSGIGYRVPNVEEDSKLVPEVVTLPTEYSGALTVGGAFDNAVLKYANGTRNFTTDATQGKGDPCTYYLGAKYRYPTQTEIAQLIGYSGAFNVAVPEPSSIKQSDMVWTITKDQKKLTIYAHSSGVTSGGTVYSLENPASGIAYFFTDENTTNGGIGFSRFAASPLAAIKYSVQVAYPGNTPSYHVRCVRDNN